MPGVYELQFAGAVAGADLVQRAQNAFRAMTPGASLQLFDIFIADSRTGVILNDGKLPAGQGVARSNDVLRKVSDRVPYFYRVKVSAADDNGQVREEVGVINTFADNKLKVKQRALGALWNEGLDTRRYVPKFDIECVMPNGAHRP